MSKILLFCAIGFIVLLIISGVDDAVRRNKNAKEIDDDRKRRERDRVNWRKVGVIRSYYNRGMMETMHRERCLVCGQENPRSGDCATSRRPCPTCEKRYQQDVADGVFPNGIPANTRGYGFACYYAFRLIDCELCERIISEAEAHDMRQSLISGVIECDRKVREYEQSQERPLDTSYRDDYLS